MNRDRSTRRSWKVPSLVLLLCAQVATAATVSPAGHFELVSDRWTNLHHFLYHWAVEEAVEKPRSRHVLLGLENLDRHLGEEDQVIWDRSVERYASVIENDLLFSDRMTELKGLIARGPAAWSAEDGILEALRAAMPVYERHYWSEHERINQRFIEDLTTLLETHEASIAEQIATEWGGSWPEEPIRVDVVNFANWAGAYTTNRPNHIVIASADSRHAGEHALEAVFHEAGHTRPLGQSLRPAANDALRETGSEDRFLWHWAIFYPIGEAVRERFPGYSPYAERQGLWKGSEATLEAFRRHWPARRRGEAALPATMVRIAAEALGTPDP